MGETKLRAFEQGTVVNNRMNLSRKEREDLRAKIEASETEQVLREFVATFEEPVNKINKTFVDYSRYYVQNRFFFAEKW